jgi:hypothetical protein
MRDDAILNTHSNVVTINAGTEAWDKDGNVVVLDESAITTEIARLQAEYDAQEYARNRQDEYPPMADQLDYMFHNGFDKWKEDIVQPVKDKYPKPE